MTESDKFHHIKQENRNPSKLVLFIYKLSILCGELVQVFFPFSLINFIYDILQIITLNQWKTNMHTVYTSPTKGYIFTQQ